MGYLQCFSGTGVGSPWPVVLFSHSEDFRAQTTSMLLTGGLEQSPKSLVKETPLLL